MKIKVFFPPNRIKDNVDCVFHDTCGSEDL